MDSFWIAPSSYASLFVAFGVLIQVYWTACDLLYAAIRFFHLIVDL